MHKGCQPARRLETRVRLRMSGLRLGFLMNVHAPRLKDGLRRFIV